MHVLSMLKESLPTDLAHEISTWIDSDLTFCFMHERGHTRHALTKWSRTMNRIIVRSAFMFQKENNSTEYELLRFLVVKSSEWKLQNHPHLLKDTLSLAIKYNHLPCIHLLLDQYARILSPKRFAVHLFVRALRHNHPHLLRLFVVYWHFEIPTSVLEKCLAWIQKTSDRAHKYASCQHECEILM